MKNEKISRRSFLKASAVASALGVMAAAPAAHAAGADDGYFIHVKHSFRWFICFSEPYSNIIRAKSELPFSHIGIAFIDML